MAWTCPIFLVFFDLLLSVSSSTSAPSVITYFLRINLTLHLKIRCHAISDERNIQDKRPIVHRPRLMRSNAAQHTEFESRIAQMQKLKNNFWLLDNLASGLAAARPSFNRSIKSLANFSGSVRINFVNHLWNLFLKILPIWLSQSQAKQPVDSIFLNWRLKTLRIEYIDSSKFFQYSSPS